MKPASAKGVTSLLGYSLLAPVALRAVVSASWRRSLKERLGKGSWTSYQPTNAPKRIWLHGASVGEVGGLSPVSAALREKYPGCEIIVTTTSLTGREEARRRGIADHVALLPLDIPFAVCRVINRIQPSLVVLNETEIWPNLLFALQARGIPVALINGRISDYSFPRYRKIRSVIAPALKSISSLSTQTEVDAERFISLGAPKEIVEVLGSTKYDQGAQLLSNEQRSAWAGELGIDRTRPVIVAGSVRPDEDEIVVRAFVNIQKNYPGAQFIIAPRHPERFEAVADILKWQHLDYRKRSDGTTSGDILLLDTLGELGKTYSLATISFVGGTLVNIGGHNPLEPVAYGSPVIVGPHVGNVRDAVAELSRAGAHLEVSSEAELTALFCELLSDEQKRNTLGEIAQRVWKQNLGATSAVMDRLRPLLEPQSHLSFGHRWEAA